MKIINFSESTLLKEKVKALEALNRTIEQKGKRVLLFPGEKAKLISTINVLKSLEEKYKGIQFKGESSFIGLLIDSSHRLTAIINNQQINEEKIKQYLSEISNYLSRIISSMDNLVLIEDGLNSPAFARLRTIKDNIRFENDIVANADNPNESIHARKAQKFIREKNPIRAVEELISYTQNDKKLDAFNKELAIISKELRTSEQPSENTELITLLKDIIKQMSTANMEEKINVRNNFNIAIGNGAVQSSTNDSSKSEFLQDNIAYGNDQLKKDVSELLNLFNQTKADYVENDLFEEAKLEMDRLVLQSTKEKKNKKIILSALDSLKTISLNVFSNAMTSPIMLQIKNIIESIG